MDPIVLVHARALLASDQRTIVVAADARDPAGIFADPAVRAHLDWAQPVAVLFVAIFHFIVGDGPARIVADVRDRLVPGSYLVVSHTGDLPDTAAGPGRAASTQAAAALYGSLAAPFVLRTSEQVSALFEGFDLVEPGVVAAHLWRPDRGRPGPAISVLAGVGRLPDPSPGPDPAPGRGPGWDDIPDPARSSDEPGGDRA
jgi:hypothetical protein